MIVFCCVLPASNKARDDDDDDDDVWNSLHSDVDSRMILKLVFIEK